MHILILEIWTFEFENNYFEMNFFNFGAFNLKIEIFKDVGYFPKGIFPGVNFPNMQLPKSVLVTALGLYCSLGHIGRPHPTFEKLPHGKFSLGKYLWHVLGYGSIFIWDQLKGLALPVKKIWKKNILKKNSKFLAYNTTRPPMSVHKKLQPNRPSLWLPICMYYLL